MIEESTRRDNNYVVINKLIDGLQELSVSPRLTWLYTWDIVKDKIDYYTPDSGESYVINPKLNEKNIWDMFWEDADRNGFSLEYGVEKLHDDVFDWMMYRDIIVKA